MEELHTVIIGAGMGGLASVIHLMKAGVAGPVRVFEASGEVGGVWSANRYPGCACDVPVQLYSFSFAQRPWPRTFASQPELLAYLKDVVREHRLEEDGVLRLHHRVVEARWQDDSRRWQVTVRAGEGEPVRYTSRFLIAAVGQFTVPKLPKFPGMDSFQGVSMHTAMWDESMDLKGKRVAVVGTGASAVQVIPHMARAAAELVVFQRTPAWIVAKKAYEIPGHKLVMGIPGATQVLRWLQFRVTEKVVPLFTNPWGPTVTKRRAIGMKEIATRMEQAVTDPQKRAALTPDYTMGCKRVLLSDGYFEAMGKDHVKLVPGGLARVTETGLIDQQGHKHDVDVVIWATGFDLASMYDNVPIYGKGGKHWGEWLRGEALGSYFGGFCVGLPNMMALQSVYVGLGHSSVVLLIEAQARMFAALTNTLLPHGVASFEVTQAAASAFRQEMQRRLSKSVWTTGGCQSWCKNLGKSTTIMWPGSVREFEDRCEEAAGHLDVFDLRDGEGSEVRVTVERSRGIIADTAKWGALGLAGALAAVALGTAGLGQWGGVALLERFE